MKKLLLLLSGIVPLSLSAQVIYHEHFSNLSLVNGCATLPAAMTQYKLDAGVALPEYYNKPFNTAPYDTLGWAVRTFDKDTFAVSSGASVSGQGIEHWLITPTITNVSSQAYIIVKALTYNPHSGWPEAVQLWVTPTLSPVPLVTDFTNNVSANILPSGIYAMSDDYNTYVIPITMFNGQDMRLAFRHLSTGGFQFLVKDIKICNGAYEDVALRKTFINPDLEEKLGMGK